MDRQAPSKPVGVSAAALVAAIGGRLEGNPDHWVSRFAPLSSACPEDATFLAHSRLRPQLASCRAGLVVLRPEDRPAQHSFQTLILTDDPYLYFARAAGHLMALQRAADVPATSIHPSANVSDRAHLGQRVRIGAGVVVEDDAWVGDDTDVGALSFIGRGARIGAASVLHPRVTIAAGVEIGERAVLQSGAILGSEGFGFAPTPERHWVKIPQVGGVVLGNDVEVGANTVIDAGTLAPTRIGHGVKLDNLIQIAHNVEIGDHTAIAGCVGIAGSAKIGAHCQIGGAAGVLGHLEIAEGSIIGPMSLVMSSITTPGKYVGIMPLQPERDWQRSAALIRRLPALRSAIQSTRRPEGDDPTESH
ncbi:MAG: UDP-3-O-(3-hydroxymyristoyl)glucosamine N-acyltransferase [Burkholderiaceae bacterium]|jgi:UDP-3-O-[3-hydroxymyristoyl] glucosamine N-acyltransferase